MGLYVNGGGICRLGAWMFCLNGKVGGAWLVGPYSFHVAAYSKIIYLSC